VKIDPGKMMGRANAAGSVFDRSLRPLLVRILLEIGMKRSAEFGISTMPSNLKGAKS
jgi:hypothetical protein